MSIFSRVRSKLGGNQEQINPHDWQLRSSYCTSSKNEKPTVIPDPGVLRNSLIPGPSVADAPEGSLVYPDVGHASVHLALVECFRNLRHSAAELGIISTTPKLPSYDFAEKPKRSPTFDNEYDNDQWSTLIRLAVTRFETWWTNIEQVFNHATAYTHHAGPKSVVQLTKDYLPPLDVLLVWYAFMLDSEEYAKACHECGMPHLLQLCFPWPAVRDSMDTETMTMTLGRPAESLFKTMTQQSANILQYIKAPPVYAEVSILSPSLDLFALVKKQEAFFEQSHKLLWIRSPSLVGSLERSASAYLEAQVTNDLFFMPATSLPFGIELIWRSHCLFPAQYRSFREATSDIVPPDEMSERLVPTVDEKPHSAPPHVDSICFCWTCERIRDDLPSFVLAPEHQVPNVAESSHGSKSLNAETLSRLSSDQLDSIQDDVAFYNAVENARRQGVPLPRRSHTPKEKEAAQLAKQRRKELGRLPSVDEYVEIGKDGKRRVKTNRAHRPTHGISMV